MYLYRLIEGDSERKYILYLFLYCFLCVIQVGTVVDSPADFYHSHIPKKQRKRTMVEELLADAEFRQ